MLCFTSTADKYLEVTISLITLSILIQVSRICLATRCNKVSNVTLNLQVVVGIVLIFLGRWNINYRGDQRKADIANNVVVILIFLVTVVNVMVSAFGPTDHSANQHGSATADSWHQVYPPSFKLSQDLGTKA